MTVLKFYLFTFNSNYDTVFLFFSLLYLRFKLHVVNFYHMEQIVVTYDGHEIVYSNFRTANDTLYILEILSSIFLFYSHSLDG